MPRASVVVATHNRAGRLRDLLVSLRAQTVPADRFEVVVVDDASDDGGATRQVLAEFAGVRALRRDTSGGPGGARNTGWRAARAPLIAFIDDDCRAAPGWLAAGLAAAEAHPGAIVQGRIDPMPEELPRLRPTARTLAVERLGPWYETANIFYPRALIERLGGFDEQSFPGYGGEDTDLAWRAIAQGTHTVWAPGAQAYHAVDDVGWLGQVRLAARWTPTMLVYKRHPQFRRAAMYKRVFWKWQHYFLVRWLAALALRRRAPALSFFLALPYNRYLLTDRGRRARWWHAPYVLVLDLVELGAVVRGAVRYRVLIL
jgi:glycosyltransferase involved in cell wall biosynthesis